MRFSKYLITIFTLLFLASCATDDVAKKTEAEVLYNEAKELKTSGRFILATEKLNMLRTNYPYSYYAKYADLLLADIQFEQENYVEAAASYLLYKDLHPKDKEIPYVMFKIAESYFKQLPSTHERDLAVAEKAISFYNELTQYYPESEYVAGANQKISECKKMIREKDKHIADFYFKTKVFLAAKIRYIEILGKYKDQGDIDLLRHSMLRIADSTLHLKEYDKCLVYVDEFRTGLDPERRDQLLEIEKKCIKGQGEHSGT